MSKIHLNNEASDPSVVLDWVMYFKSGGLYARSSGGVIGPFVTSSGINPNALPNGGFRVAQRGAGPFISTGQFVNNDDSYLLDGCVLLSDGNDIVDVSQVADTDFVSGYKIRLDVETANKRFGVMLPIENKDIQDIRKSGLASLQFKVKCTGTSMSNVRAYVLSWGSTADAITSDVVNGANWGAAGANPTFATNWTAENTAANIAINTTVATKNIQNIAVDTAGVTNLAVLIIVDDTDAQVGDFLEIGDVKLESGAVCTAYVNKNFSEEWFDCKRLFRSYGQEGITYEVVSMGKATSTTSAEIVWQLAPGMRIAPVLGYGTVGNWCVVAANGSAVALTALATTAVCHNRQAVFMTGTVASGLTAGDATYLMRNNNTTDLLTLSSEL